MVFERVKTSERSFELLQLGIVNVFDVADISLSVPRSALIAREWC